MMFAEATVMARQLLSALVLAVLIAGMVSTVSTGGDETMFAPGEGRLLLYETYDVDTGDVVYAARRSIRYLSPATLRVDIDWRSDADSTAGHQRYVVDNEHATLEWTVKHPHEQTDYRGVRDGDGLRIVGTLNGEAVDERIEIDNKPFYNNPSFGLEGFVRSGREKAEFRTLRPDNLAEYKMKAKVEEREAIVVQGKEVAAVRVKWGLTGFRSMFFSQTLWFRESDGVFLKTAVEDGEFTELVGERIIISGTSHHDGGR